MTNVALEWPALQGVDMRPPDRVETLAQIMADRPRHERAPMATRLQQKHGRALAETVRDRAVAILQQRRGTHDGR